MFLSYELIKSPSISDLAALADSSAKSTISADLLILLFVSRQKNESSEAIRLSHVSCDLYVPFFEQFSKYCFIILLIHWTEILWIFDKGSSWQVNYSEQENEQYGSIFQCTNCWLLVTHGFSLLPVIRQTKNGLFMISIVMEGDWFMGPDSTIRICWTRGTNIIYLTNVAHIAMKWLAVIEPRVHIFIARLFVDSMVILYHSWTCEASIYGFSWTFAI